jgi:tetratricopeptide (TPR) repeat protein
LTIKGLKAGAYTVTIRKPNFHDESRVIEVAAGKKHTAEFVLSPMPGNLSVTSSVSGAQIEIDQITFRDNAQLTLSPGLHKLSISKLGYRTTNRDFSIASAQTLNLTITLEKLPFEEMMTLSTKSYSEHRFNETIELTRDILLTHPNVPQVHYLLAYSYYITGNYDGALEHFTKVLSLGEKNVFLVKHRHGRVMCMGTITMSKTTFAFKSENIFGHDFEVPYTNFKESILDVQSGGFLHTKVRIPKSDGKKGEDEKDYNFYVREAESPSSIIGCSNCQARMEIIRRLMLWARGDSTGGP